MIRFWGRKPHNIVSKYIEHYTDEGEIVLDPFAGCGVSVIEAARLGRKGIYNDLNKLCHFIARTSFEKLDIEELNECFDLLMERIKYKKTRSSNGERSKEENFNRRIVSYKMQKLWEQCRDNRNRIREEIQISSTTSSFWRNIGRN